MLEAQCHEYSFFSTFTYEVEPDGRSLVKSHISETMHRLRASARGASRTVRFYAVGEYGDRGGRPHYHAAIFGLGPSDVGLIDRAWQGIDGVENGPRAGITHHGVLAPDAAAYITGYITKKLTRPDSRGLDGRAPEFAVMSRNPGIGLLALPMLVECFNTSAGALYMSLHGDVPAAIAVGGRSLPLGNFLRGKLRAFFFGDHRQPRSGADVRGLKAHEKFLEETYAELPPLQVDSPTFALYERWAQAHSLHKVKEVTAAQQRARNVAGRHKIMMSRKPL